MVMLAVVAMVVVAILLALEPSVRGGDGRCYAACVDVAERRRLSRVLWTVLLLFASLSVGDVY